MDGGARRGDRGDRVATQDIVIDAFRVEYLPTENQAAGMAYFVAAYRIGMLVSTAGAVALVAYFEHIGIDRGLVWTYGYAVMAAFVVIGMVAALLAKEPRAKNARPRPKLSASARPTRCSASSARPMRPSPISSRSATRC